MSVCALRSCSDSEHVVASYVHKLIPKAEPFVSVAWIFDGLAAGADMYFIVHATDNIRPMREAGSLRIQ